MLLIVIIKKLIHNCVQYFTVSENTPLTLFHLSTDVHNIAIRISWQTLPILPGIVGVHTLRMWRIPFGYADWSKITTFAGTHTRREIFVGCKQHVCYVHIVTNTAYFPGIVGVLTLRMWCIPFCNYEYWSKLQLSRELIPDGKFSVGRLMIKDVATCAHHCVQFAPFAIAGKRT